MLQNLMRSKKTRSIICLTLFCFILQMIPLGQIRKAKASDTLRWDTGAQTGPVSLWSKIKNKIENIRHPSKNETEDAEPVNLFNGNFTYNHIDFIIPARGIPLTATHTYSAQTTYNSFYGYGWTINYDISLSVFSQDNTILMRKGLENQRRYLPSENPGEYTPPSGVHDKLVKNEDGTFTLTEKNRTVYEFDEEGNLIAIRDRNNNQITIHYSENKQPVTGILYGSEATGIITYRYRIEEIEDPSGRKLIFSYDVSGRLSQITDFANRTFSYEYDDKGDLVKIINPLGDSKKFSYEDHNLIQETDFKGNILLSNTYDAEDKVIAQNYLGGQYTFSYDIESHITTTVDPLGTTTVQEMNESGNPIRITRDPDGDNLVTTRTYNENMDVLSETDAEGHTTTYTYDAQGNLLSFTNALNQTTQYTYHPDFNTVTSRVDPLGKETTYEYDANGNLLKVTDAMGKEKIFTYNEFGQLTSETDLKGNVTQYDLFNEAGYPEKIIDPLNNESTFVYNDLGWLLASIDAEGRATQYTYDLRGLPLTVTDPLGNTVEYTYDQNGKKTSFQDQNGNTIQFSYNGYGYLIGITDPLNNETGFSYDPAGNRVSITDANGKIIYFKYNKYGLIAKIVRKVGDTEDLIDSNDAVSIFTYDKVGNRLSIVDANDFESTFEYDVIYQLIRRTNPENETESFTYDAAGNLKTHTNPSGYVLIYNYDDNYRILNLSNVNGVLESYQYDDNGNLTHATDQNGNTTITVYDELNRPVEIHDPYSEITRNIYDKVGNLLSSTDREGNITRFEYDELNRKTKIIDASNHETLYSYDSAGNLLSISDSKGNLTAYQYNDLNLLVAETYADNGIKNFSYDKVGNLVQRQDQNGQVTDYGYNDLYQLVSKSYPNRSEHNCSFSYDKAGRMLTAQNGFSTLSFAFDKANRLVESNQNGKSVSYSYNISNREKTIVYPSGRQIRRTADQLSRLANISVFNGSEFVSVAQYQYDGNHLQTRVLSNGVSTQFLYDFNSQITDLMHVRGQDKFADFSYGYNKEGIISSRRDLEKINYSEIYGYDEVYRLVNAKRGVMDQNDMIQNPLVQVAYNLDSLGNWQSRSVNDVTESRQHNEVNEITSVGATNYVYDDNGNLIDDGDKLYEYDPENRLISITLKADSSVISVYRFDALGRRISKKVGSSTETYYYDGSMVIEQWINDVLDSQFIFGLSINDPVVMFKGGQTYYYHADANGNICAITDSNGNVVERYAYSPYGAVEFFDSQWNALNESTIGNVFLFAGLRLDNESGFYHARARAYSSDLGRFIQRDAMGYVDGMNLYEYARSNPINYVDITGYICWGQVIKAAVITVALVAVAVAFVVAAPVAVGFLATALGASATTAAAVASGTAITLKVAAGAYLAYSATTNTMNRANQLKMNNIKDPMSLKAAMWGIGDVVGYTGIYEGSTGREAISGTALSEYEASNRLGKGIAQTAITVTAIAYAGYKGYKNSHAAKPVGGHEGTRVGYHATSHEAASSIRKTGFRPGTKPGRLGSGGTYVSNTRQGAIAEFKFHNPGVKPEVLKVRYQPGVEAVTDVSPQHYAHKIPLNVDSITTPSVRHSSSMITNTYNPVEVLP